jgi:hypothetical protein
VRGPARRTPASWVSRLHAKFQIRILFTSIPQQPKRRSSAFSAFGTDSKPSAQIAHAQPGFSAREIPDINFANTFADTDVHEPILDANDGFRQSYR